MRPRRAATAALSALAVLPPVMDASMSVETKSLAVVELRQYTLKPGQRDVLIELFDREFVETQEAEGMAVLGQFRDLDRPDRFVWIRGFRDMPSRARALGAFYGGPVWRRHAAAANATMIDSDDVLLLRPARPGSGFALEPGDRPPAGATAASPGRVTATIVAFDGAVPPAFAELFERRVRPVLAETGARVLATFETETSPNNFPRLPVRDGARVFVWFASFADEAALAQHVARRDASPAWRRAAKEIAALSKGAPEVLRLAPTVRSSIRG